ncbi:MAG: two-component regulator propeller domain-containing protein [Candidatus Latescibacterota bacterium]
MGLLVAALLAVCVVGPVRAEGPEWAAFSTANSGLPCDCVNGMAMDRDGALWITTGQDGRSEPEPWVGGGVARFDGWERTVLTSADSPLPENRVSSLYVDPRGNLWIGTYGGGLARHRRGGLLFGTSTAVAEDRAASAPLPPQAALGPNCPNPLNAATVIPFALPQAGRVELTVHDLAGQVVRTLVQAWVPAGEQQVHWRGDDDAGRAAASAVYLCRLRTPWGTKTRRLVLLR